MAGLRLSLRHHIRNHPDLKLIAITKEAVSKYARQFNDIQQLSFGDMYDGVIVVTMNDVLVGAVQCNLRDGSLHYIGVSESFRRAGYGSLLMRMALKSFNCRDLNVRKTNLITLAFCEKHGFSIVNESTNYYRLELKK